MDHEDRMSIATPEGLELDLVLAGVGSRLVAALLDGLVRVAILLAVVVATVIAHPDSGVVFALLALAFFFLYFGYDVFFEVAAGGRTPGKRWSGLRVVTLSGAAVGVGASVVRNLLRLVDALPGMYLVGIVLVVLTRRNQRLGDLVAGTLVVRDRRAVDPELSLPPLAFVQHDGLAAWDASAVTAEELATVRKFLERRHSLDPTARRRIGEQLASRLLPKVVVPGEPKTAEMFLLDLVAVKSRRG